MIMKMTDLKINGAVSSVLKSTSVLISIIIVFPGYILVRITLIVIIKSKLLFLLLKGGAVHAKIGRNSGYLP